ncbi:zinc finger BED domain-containing protein DAYSLEEPER-like [Camellia sinensis]|uniref:zinc finger BED domain-containing protein DAYSLEEPER-like n=1 Tax=Camellia sinensis TaxID=4442 RepID=UPI0010357DD9|nr:zinc finger BED domain-containing protein DAYSLEEPER-like [Camellia sinensis]
MSSTMDLVNMSSTGDTNDVIDLSQSQSDKEHDPQPETPSGSKFETVASSSNEMVHEVDIVDQVNIGASEHQVSLMTKFQKLLEEEEGDGEKSEVDRYLEESCKKEVVNFDILSWWKTNSFSSC